MRVIQRGEVLIEQGDRNFPFFVVVTGEVEIVRPSDAAETLITIHGPGNFLDEVNAFSGRPPLFRARVTKPGELIELDRQHMLTLVQTDAELGDIVIRAFVLRRVEFVTAGVGDVVESFRLNLKSATKLQILRDLIPRCFQTKVYFVLSYIIFPYFSWF